MRRKMMVCSLFAMLLIPNSFVFANDADIVTNDIIQDDYQIDRLKKSIKILELKTKLEQQKRKLEEAKKAKDDNELDNVNVVHQAQPPLIQPPAIQDGNLIPATPSNHEDDIVSKYEKAIVSGNILTKQIIENGDHKYAVLSMHMGNRSGLLRVKKGDEIFPGIKVVDINNSRVEVKVAKKGEKAKNMNIWLSDDSFSQDIQNQQQDNLSAPSLTMQ